MNADPALKDAFILDGKTLKVGSQSDLINYEQSKVFTILVKSTDSGEPPLSLEDTFNVVITDVNDPPTDIVLDNSDVSFVQFIFIIPFQTNSWGYLGIILSIHLSVRSFFCLHFCHVQLKKFL